MGIILGLTAALCWGASDFLARYATLRAGFFRTLVILQVIGGILLGGALLVHGEFASLAHLSWAIWGLAILSGMLNILGSLALYRAIEIGVLSVVTPITATFAAVTVVLALATGEAIAMIRGWGIVLTLAGALLVSFIPPSPAHERIHHQAAERLAVFLAALASVSYGVNFWILGKYLSPAMGEIAPTWIIRVVSFTVLVIVALATRMPLRPPHPVRWRPTLVLIVLIAVVDSAAYITNLLGYRSDAVAIVTVLASLYGLVTVALAAIFLRERLIRSQWVGIAVIFAGIVLVSLRTP